MPVRLAIKRIRPYRQNGAEGALRIGASAKRCRSSRSTTLGDAQTNAHLTRYDSAHGRFPFQVEVGDGELVVNGDPIKVLAERNPADLPWKELGVDIVLECTGLFTTRDKASAHLEAGAKKVVVSAPAGTNTDATIVYGVQPPHSGSIPSRHFQRLMHHQLPGAGGQGAA